MHASRTINQELGIKFNFHNLRHTHATMLAENGVNVKNLQARLGHELAQTTMQNYVHDTDRMANQAVDTFERLIRGQK
jgi:integrase